jgi:PKD repeat protein
MLTYEKSKRVSGRILVISLVFVCVIWSVTSPMSAATVDFSGSPQTGNADLTVQFTDLSVPTVNITGWHWDFGDGQTSNAQHPLHSYVTAGNFRVNLTVEDNGSFDSEVKVDYIQVNPLAVFSGTPTIGDAPLSVQFTDASKGFPNNWSWDFNGDGIVDSYDQNPAPYAYTIAGRYNVTLTVMGNDFRTNTSTLTQYITARPLNSFNANVTSGKAPLAVQFNDTSTGSPTSWAWNFGGDGTSTSQNPLHIFNTAGIYAVTLVATRSGVSGSPAAIRDITVYPDADFIAVPQSGIYPLTVQFTDTSTGNPNSWSWEFGDGQTSTVQNPTHVYTSIGAYTVTLTVSRAGLSDTEQKTNFIFVNTPPRPLRANINGKTSFFSVDRIVGTAPFTATFYPYPSRLQKETTYTWDFGDGSAPAVVGVPPGNLWWVPQFIQHTYTNPGVYSVTLTVRNSPTDYYSITMPNYVRVR